MIDPTSPLQVGSCKGRPICSSCGFPLECAAHLVPAANGAALISVCRGCFLVAQVRQTLLAYGSGTSARNCAETSLESLYEGTTEEKLILPPHIRAALCEVGLRKSLAPVNLFEIQEKEPLLMSGDAWNDGLPRAQPPTILEFEVALDSGAVVHVCEPADSQGYSLEESPGSRRGQVPQGGRRHGPQYEGRKASTSSTSPSASPSPACLPSPR